MKAAIQTLIASALIFLAPYIYYFGKIRALSFDAENYLAVVLGVIGLLVAAGVYGEYPKWRLALGWTIAVPLLGLMVFVALLKNPFA